VKSLKTNETLYALNARRLMMPASNMKIVTLAAAADRLGWDFTYETTLLAAGSIQGGVLRGDVIVVGSGDPSIGAANDSAGLFAEWADRLKALGVRTVAGRIIGDDNAFDDEGLGFGWSWDDLPDDYAAGVSALQYDESAVRVTVAPGPSAGDWAAVSVAPTESGLIIDTGVTTSSAGTATRIEAHRLPGSAVLRLRGIVPLGASAVTRVVSVDNPTQFFVNVLRHALIERGIDVAGPAVDIDDVTDAPARTNATTVATHRSPPLSTLAVRLMKISQNLYAETLLKTIGARAGTPTALGGRAAAQSALQAWGIGADGLIQRDGSGLSRYDYVTAEALVTILTHVDRDPRLKEPFESALPIAGRDGTLSNRMKGTAAEGNARAKTGSMTNVRGLSGYVNAGDGEPLAFSILANNFETPPATINAAADAIVVRLAQFKR
jgi:D-alanyl-D-alanine carboxypeptidase/D-alanyl-D-alanine-endopeptidase (penicillin-binding protein 4)